MIPQIACLSLKDKGTKENRSEVLVLNRREEKLTKASYRMDNVVSPIIRQREKTAKTDPGHREH